MATIIENPQPNPNNRTVMMDSGDSSAGWAVAVIILLIVIVGGAFWYAHHYRAAAPAPAGTTVQVNLPGNGGDTTGSAQPAAGSNTQ